MATRLGTDELNEADVIRIDVLPDDVLLDIFEFYMYSPAFDIRYDDDLVEAWQTLVHVCRRWRGLVFRSPRRLNLQLCCTPKTRTRDTLDVWPALPLIVVGGEIPPSRLGTDNIVAGLERSNRVCQVILWAVTDWQLEKASAAMQVPFLELTHLELCSKDDAYGRQPTFDIPDSFLGGSAPSLRYFELDGIPFPGLPNFLLSAPNLVELRLTYIPHSGYMSPEAIVAPLSSLSSLEEFYLGFESPRSRPDRESLRLPPRTRSILPALRYFQFNGVIEYLEELVTRIDTPQLDFLELSFSDQIDFDIQRLVQFVDRTPKISKRDKVYVDLRDTNVYISFGVVQIWILFSEPDRQLSSVSRLFSSSLSSTVQDLYIEHRYSGDWPNYAIENTLWLQLLLPFTAVKNLYLNKDWAPSIAGVLQELVGDRIIGILPSLQNIFVDKLDSGLFENTIGQFVVARQLSGHPVTVSNWDRTSYLGLCT